MERNYLLSNIREQLDILAEHGSQKASDLDLEFVYMHALMLVDYTAMARAQARLSPSPILDEPDIAV